MAVNVSEIMRKIDTSEDLSPEEIEAVNRFAAQVTDVSERVAEQMKEFGAAMERTAAALRPVVEQWRDSREG